MSRVKLIGGPGDGREVEWNDELGAMRFPYEEGLDRAIASLAPQAEPDPVAPKLRCARYELSGVPGFAAFVGDELIDVRMGPLFSQRGGVELLGGPWDGRFIAVWPIGKALSYVHQRSDGPDVLGGRYELELRNDAPPVGRWYPEEVVNGGEGEAAG